MVDTNMVDEFDKYSLLLFPHFGEMKAKKEHGEEAWRTANWWTANHEERTVKTIQKDKQ